MKMVVVGQVRSFVASRLSGHVNRLEVPFFNQTLQSAIDCGDAQSRHIGLSFGQHFQGSQGTFAAQKNTADRIPLAGLSIHPGIFDTSQVNLLVAAKARPSIP